MATGSSPDEEDRTPRGVRLSDLLDRLDAEARRCYEAHAKGSPLGARTGLDVLDTAIGGYLRPGIHVLQGPAGVGKSALAQQIASTAGVPALLVSMELSPLELLLRHTARATGTPLSELKGSPSPMEPGTLLELATNAANNAPMLSLLDARMAWPPISSIEQAAIAARGEDPHVLVVIDSLHSWADGSPGGAGEYERLNEALRLCLGLAASLSAPVLVVAELSRAATFAADQSRTKARIGGNLSASAGTRKFEYAAETVFDLSREKRKTDSRGSLGRETQELICTIEKNRHGVRGAALRLIWDPSLMRISMPGQSQGPAPEEAQAPVPDEAQGLVVADWH